MIKTTPRNIAKVSAFIRSIPAGAKIVVAEAVSRYLVGNSQRGLKHEPAWKFVSRAKAYGKVSDAPAGYFSWKQFRYVAAITDGFTKIPKPRTHELANGWEAVRSGSNWQIVNDVDGIGWVMGHNQARQPMLVGWRNYIDVINSNLGGALRAGTSELNKWLRQRAKKG